MADSTLNIRAGSIGGTSMRYHELAVQLWLNRRFFVAVGYPIPVVFTSPMDAFSQFQQLFKQENSPFQYLLNAKDANGTPLYEPFPSPVRYPIISVHRKGWKYRSYQNMSIHRLRHIDWPTISDTGTNVYGKQQNGVNLTRADLGNVTTSRRPMAWDYRFQIDHFCNRPDTQAYFVEQLMQEFWRTGGAPQTWSKVDYPGFGPRLVRLYLDGDVESLTPEEPEEGKKVEFRTSFTLVMEGFDIDLRYKVYPAVWTLLFENKSVDPETLATTINFYGTVDLRRHDNNPTLDSRHNVPAEAQFQLELVDAEPQTTPLPVPGLFNTGFNRYGRFTIS